MPVSCNHGMFECVFWLFIAKILVNAQQASSYHVQTLQPEMTLGTKEIVLKWGRVQALPAISNVELLSDTLEQSWLLQDSKNYRDVLTEGIRCILMILMAILLNCMLQKEQVKGVTMVVKKQMYVVWGQDWERLWKSHIQAGESDVLYQLSSCL